jgi:hypothetical protein
MILRWAWDLRLFRIKAGRDNQRSMERMEKIDAGRIRHDERRAGIAD